MKKLHLWVGLICSIIILLESVTGLMLEEPQWFGGSNVNSEGRFNPGGFQGNFNPGQFNQGDAGQASGGQTDGSQPNDGQANNGQAGNRQFGSGRFGNFNGQIPDRGGMGSLRQTVEELHRGVINGVDVHWIMDVVAIGLIFLSGSGIYMSIRILAAQRKGKKKQEDQL